MIAPALIAGLFLLGAAQDRAGGAVAPPAPDPFTPPAEFARDFGPYRSPLVFEDGRTVSTPEDWQRRRREIRETWHAILGAWPSPIERPRVETLATERRDGFEQRRVRLEVAPDRDMDGYLLVPEGQGPFPAVLVVYYEPETAIGLGKPRRDFALQLVRRGFVALSIGVDPLTLDPPKNGIDVQPLSYLAYVAANTYNAMAALPEIDPARVGVMGHSYGGKWAMFAACLCDKFACGVWSDPGIVFDEARPNVNYWEPWYLGHEPGKSRPRGPLAPGEPRRGAYARLVAGGHDLHELHALMAPRPFLVSGGSEDPADRWKALNHSVAVNRLLGVGRRVAMTNRPGHDPTDESNEQIYRFLAEILGPAGDRR